MGPPEGRRLPWVPAQWLCLPEEEVMFYAWFLILPRQSLAIFNPINHYCWLPGDGSLISVRNSGQKEESKCTPAHFLLPECVSHSLLSLPLRSWRLLAALTRGSCPVPPHRYFCVTGVRVCHCNQPYLVPYTLLQ